MVFKTDLTYFAVTNNSIGINVAFITFDGRIRDCSFGGVKILSLLSSVGIGLVMAVLFSTFIGTGNLCTSNVQEIVPISNPYRCYVCQTLNKVNRRLPSDTPLISFFRWVNNESFA